MTNARKIENAIHYLEMEIKISEKRMLEYGECFDGIEVKDKVRKELLKSHIRYCNHIKSILLGEWY